MEYLQLFLLKLLNSFTMMSLFLIFTFSLNAIYSHAEVNDSIVEVNDSIVEVNDSIVEVNDSIVDFFCDRYLNDNTAEKDNSIDEENDSLYLNVIRILCDSFLYKATKKDSLFVQFNDIVFKNYLLVEKELNTLSVSDKFPNKETTVYTINKALIDLDVCFISVAIQSLDLYKKQLITSAFLYFIFKRKEGEYVLEKIIEDSF